MACEQVVRSTSGKGVKNVTEAAQTFRFELGMGVRNARKGSQKTLCVGEGTDGNLW
jgi:hypothetical protein